MSDIPGIVVDKHSTGGVGDKTTLVLIPMLAACGAYVAKLSGRGLGFTGGTADKLEAICGFRIALTNQEFISQIKRIGVAISSQTKDLAPADAIVYALRDVTATVESIPLIAASVVSKKIAAGAKVIVLDIKYGRGAFMKTLEDAKSLAHACREIGKRLGRSISTVISSMEQPLGNAIGHSLEVKETIQTLKGQGPADLRELSLVLGSVALLDAGICKTLDEARMRLAKTLDDGSALAKFAELIASQGGDVSVITNEDALPKAPGVVSIFSPQTGYVQSLDSLKIAMAAKLLGAGRDKKEDQIDLSVGVVLLKKVGDPVKQREAIAILHTGTKPSETAAVNALNAFVIGDVPPSIPALVDEVVF
jgi:pyrimidine-nucleoside phosphorylase